MFDFGLGYIADDDESVSLGVEVLLGDTLNVFLRHTFDLLRILGKVFEAQAVKLYLSQHLCKFGS